MDMYQYILRVGHVLPHHLSVSPIYTQAHRDTGIESAYVTDRFATVASKATACGYCDLEVGVCQYLHDITLRITLSNSTDNIVCTVSF